MDWYINLERNKQSLLFNYLLHSIPNPKIPGLSTVQPIKLTTLYNLALCINILHNSGNSVEEILAMNVKSITTHLQSALLPLILPLTGSKNSLQLDAMYSILSSFILYFEVFSLLQQSSLSYGNEAKEKLQLDGRVVGGSLGHIKGAVAGPARLRNFPLLKQYLVVGHPMLKFP